MFVLKRIFHKFFDPVKSGGQAVLESILVLPFLLMVFCSLMLGFHHLGSRYLFDHWTYQSALCLVRENDLFFCKDQLKKRLGLIPFSRFSITEFHKNEKQVRVRVKTNTPFLSDGEIFEKLRLPIKISDLEALNEK